MYMKMMQQLDETTFKEVPYVLRMSTHSVIPFVDSNADYQEYLGWLEDGNEPLPYDHEVYLNGIN